MKSGHELKKDWETFHQNNPKVFALITKYAIEAMKSGLDHYSIKGIFEQIRWDFNVKTQDKEFKLSNNYSAYYARHFHKCYPQFDGFFITHKAKGDLDEAA